MGAVVSEETETTAAGVVGSVAGPGKATSCTGSNTVPIAAVGILVRVRGTWPHTHLIMPVPILGMAVVTSGDTNKNVCVCP